MAEQIYKDGYCNLCKKTTRHISTVSPTGFWVCTNPECCQTKCSELKEEEGKDLKRLIYY